MRKIRNTKIVLDIVAPMKIIGTINSLTFTTKLLFTMALLLVVVLPRFNRNTLIVKRELHDAKYFIAYVEYFRGETPSNVIRPASNWRVLIPFIAATLPFAPLTAINLVNCIAIACSTLLLYLTLRHFIKNNAYHWLGCWLFIFSFPTFYYTTIGYIDPGVVFFTMACTYATVKKNAFVLLLSFALGCLTKETIVLSIPFAVMYYWKTHRTQAWVIGIALFVCYVVINFLLRQYAYITPGEQNPTMWQFSFEALKANLNRFNSYAAPLLSFGVPGVLFVYTLRKMGIRAALYNPLMLATVAYVACGWLLFLISACATFCDGRIIWQTNFAMILCALIYAAQTLEGKS